MDANVGYPRSEYWCVSQTKNQRKTQIQTNVPSEFDQRLPKVTYICLKQHTFKLRGETL